MHEHNDEKCSKFLLSSLRLTKCMDMDIIWQTEYSPNSFLSQTIRCTIDIIKQRELPASQPLMISVAIGNLVKTIGAIRLITEHDNLVVNVLTPVIVGVIILSAVLSLVTGLLVGYARARSIKLSSTKYGYTIIIG